MELAVRMFSERHCEVVWQKKTVAAIHLDPATLPPIPVGVVAIESSGELTGKHLILRPLNPSEPPGYPIAQTIPLPAKPYFVTATDLNQDGHQDLVTANRGPLDGRSANNTVSVSLGSASGRFSSPSHFEVGTGPYTVEDTDGTNDLLVASFYEWRGRCLTILSGAEVLRRHALARFKPECALRLGSRSKHAAFQRSNLQINPREGFRLRFRLQRIIGGPLEIWLGFRGDSIADRSGLLLQLESKRLDLWARESGKWDRFSADFDGRVGTGDVVELAVSGGSEIALLINGETQSRFSLSDRFKKHSGRLPVGSFGFQVANPSVELLIDDVEVLNGAGDRRFVYDDFNDGDLSAWKDLGGNGSMTACSAGYQLLNGRSSVRLRTLRPVKAKASNWPQPGCTSLAARDFNGDGHVDIAAVCWTSDSLHLLRGDGKGRFTPVEHHQSSQIGHGLRDIKTADLDGDGQLDLAITCYVSNHIAIFRGLGDGRFCFSGRYSSGGRTPYHLAVGDLDGDDLPDIVVGNYSGALRVFRNRGAGLEFEVAQTLSRFGAADRRQNEIRDVAIADFNQDGTPDLAVACASPHSGYVSFLHGSPGKSVMPDFATVSNVYLGRRPRSFFFADLFGNGCLAGGIIRHDANDLLILKLP